MMKQQNKKPKKTLKLIWDKEYQNFKEKYDCSKEAKMPSFGEYLRFLDFFKVNIKEQPKEKIINKRFTLSF